MRALVKLEQVLPAHLRRRVAALGSATIALAGRRADRRPAAPDDDRRRVPRLRAPALRLPQPRRHREPPRGRAALARQPRPALVPRRLGPRPRGLAHVPRRPARRARRRPACASRRAQLPAEDAARLRRSSSIAGAPQPLRGRASRVHAPADEIAGRVPATGAAIEPIDDRPLRVPDRRRRPRAGSRCASRCSASTSRCTSRPSWSSTCGPSPPGCHGR